MGSIFNKQDTELIRKEIWKIIYTTLLLFAASILAIWFAMRE